MWIWFLQERQRPISGSVLKEQALDIRKKRNVSEFIASDGWLIEQTTQNSFRTYGSRKDIF